MTVEERVNKVREIELSFVSDLLTSTMNYLATDKGLRKMLKEVAGIDAAKAKDMLELSKQIDEAMPKLEESRDYHNNIVEKINSSPSETLLIRGLKNSGNDYSNEEIKKALTGIKMNKKVLDVFFNLYNYVISILKRHADIAQEESPVIQFKNFKKFNKFSTELAMSSMANENQTIYEVAKKIFDSHLNDELDELLSITSLRLQIEQESCENKKTEAVEQVKTPLYELANAEVNIIENDIEELSKIDIAGEDLAKIIARKQHYDGIFGHKFVKVDDSTLIEIARDYLAEILIMISELKSKIFDTLDYAGADIKDILREKHSYQIRDYVEKLKVMSAKYQTLLEGLNKEKASELVFAYSKALAMYKVVDEMKANSYVVDISRFSK